MNNKFFEIFNGLVPQENMNLLLNDFEKVADTKIIDLGVDSLAIMEVVLRIEECLDIEINYENFKVEQIETPRQILEMFSTYIEKRRN